ncbi:TPA: hypothetical protein PFE81_003537 [Vibrio cholerae]|uniref:hypothetical protein n=3 Tax=Vibrio cholerae TaxID=666 RepID=UPI000841A0DB|nr:hypothetical protein [Vibrio cholerae]HDG1726961.1 hypothetical protein [Vibrio cholerae]
MENIVLVDEVFRTSRDLPQNYISRSHVDDLFVESLAKQTHIVVHGSSKQGKTSLRKKNLLESDYIVLTCSNNWSIADINESILKRAGYQITISESKTIKGTSKVSLSISLNDTKIGSDISMELAKQINKKNLELDLENTNDVISALKEIDFNKYIVLEDFHYLKVDTQVDFSIALKAYHEESPLCFIIIGVWLEDDRLTTFNGDLAGRIVSINADEWLDENIDELFAVSEALLNISFSNGFKESVKQKCNGSIFLVQQLCMKVCETQGISKTQQELTEVAKNIDITEEIKSVLNMHTGRFTKFLMDFSSGFQPTELELYKWILFALITIDEKYLLEGLPIQALKRQIQLAHPKKSEVSLKKLSGALNKAVDLQLANRTKPIVFEYDSNRSRVKVVDKSFLLWKQFQELPELLAYIDLEVFTDEFV